MQDDMMRHGKARQVQSNQGTQQQGNANKGNGLSQHRKIAASFDKLCDNTIVGYNT